MQALSDKQVQKISQLIRDHHTAFMVTVLGEDSVPPEEFERLVKSGLVDPKAIKSLPRDAYTFGALADALAENKSKNLSYDQFEKYVETHPVPLSAEEKFAVKHLKRSLMNHIKGLGNVVDKRTHQVLIDNDSKLQRKLATNIQAKLVEGVERRKTVQEVATELRRSTQDYARDWLRIAYTELNNAYQEGKAQAIMKSNKGRDPLVFKRPRPDCCDECRKAYLISKGVPRVFRLSELVNNGTNIGKSANFRRPVIGAHHPWCACELHEMPPGFEFDKHGKMHYAGIESGE